MIEATIQNPERLETVRVDSQGRVNLGVQYAGREVEIVVVESRELESDESPLQQPIGDHPLTEQERKGMIYIRSFGISPRFLVEGHTAVKTEDGVDVETVAPTDVDWSHGFLVEPKNVARFVFDEDAAPDRPSFTEKYTAEPVDCTQDSTDDTTIYRYENEQGDTSAIAEEFVSRVEPIFGYNPTEDLSNVRIDPDQGPAPVLFTDPESDTYLAIAPRVE